MSFTSGLRRRRNPQSDAAGGNAQPEEKHQPSDAAGGNPQLVDPDDAALTNTGGTNKIYLPDNTASFVYAMASGTATRYAVSTSASSVSASTITYSVERVCSAKYTPIQMRFINKNGMPQDHYFFLKMH